MVGGWFAVACKNYLVYLEKRLPNKVQRTGKLAVNIHFESNFSTYHRIKAETETGACHEQTSGGTADAEIKVAPDEISRWCVFSTYS